jgi:c-di-GMP-binding flagellar brake protein YcgR
MGVPPSYIRQPWPKTRQYVRHSLEGRLTIAGPAGRVRGWLHDISEDGLGGVISARIEPNTEVAVEFELRPGESLVRATASVRFASGFRYGFQFAKLTPEQREAIRQYCTAAARS